MWDFYVWGATGRFPGVCGEILVWERCYLGYSAERELGEYPQLK